MKLKSLLIFALGFGIGAVAIASLLIQDEPEVATPTPVAEQSETELPKPPKEKSCEADAISEEDFQNISLSGEVLETQADRLVAQKNYPAAIRKFNEAIAGYYKASGLPADESKYKDIAALKQTHPKAMEKAAQLLVQVGRAYTQLQKFENAADCFSTAIRFRIDKPNDAIAYLNRADAYQRLGKRVEALEDFTTASDLFKQYKLPKYQKEADDRIKGLSSPTSTRSQ